MEMKQELLDIIKESSISEKTKSYGQPEKVIEGPRKFETLDNGFYQTVHSSFRSKEEAAKYVNSLTMIARK